MHSYHFVVTYYVRHFISFYNLTNMKAFFFYKTSVTNSSMHESYPRNLSLEMGLYETSGGGKSPSLPLAHNFSTTTLTSFSVFLVVLHGWFLFLLQQSCLTAQSAICKSWDFLRHWSAIFILVGILQAHPIFCYCIQDFSANTQGLLLSALCFRPHFPDVLVCLLGSRIR